MVTILADPPNYSKIMRHAKLPLQAFRLTGGDIHYRVQLTVMEKLW